MRCHGGIGSSKFELTDKEKIMNSLVTRGNFFDDFFHDVAPGFYIKPLHGDPLPSPDQIKIDVKEDDKTYTVNAEVPGVKKEDINVSIDGNIVTLSSEIKQENKTGGNGEKMLRSERFYGAISRSFQLPQEVDEKQSKAKYDNGVLCLTLPKKATNGGAKRLTIE
jgi:HSP20 family protein